MVVSGGDPEFNSWVLARAAVAAGLDALFCEIHRDPDRALSEVDPTHCGWIAWKIF